MADIYERVLVRCDPAWYGLRDDPPSVFAALRAVVERHAPVLCRFGNCLNPHHRVCSACGSGINHPCPELLLIASELGIEATS